MLKDFYTLNTLQQIAANTYLCTLTLNAEHPIFKGHFPNNPVTPGVCMMQIVKNLTEQITGHQLQLTPDAQCKIYGAHQPRPSSFLATFTQFANPRRTSISKKRYLIRKHYSPKTYE